MGRRRRGKQASLEGLAPASHACLLMPQCMQSQRANAAELLWAPTLGKCAANASGSAELVCGPTCALQASICQCPSAHLAPAVDASRKQLHICCFEALLIPIARATQLVLRCGNDSGLHSIQQLASTASLSLTHLQAPFLVSRRITSLVKSLFNIVSRVEC